MAQELTDKIRAAAQAKGIDPDTALAIAKAESSLRPNATPGTSSAGGLFQVVDKTWKEFGGKPGKKFDPDENIRVGTDIIAKNTQTLKSFLQRDPRPAEIYAAHYFGANGAKSFLTAEPNTPMESLFPAKVIKANPNLKGKTSGQVLASLETKMGSAPAVSRETPAPVTREPLPPSLPPMAAAPAAATVAAAPTGSKMASLGPSYQAALALSFLADTDDKEDRDIDREPGVAEKWLAQMDAAPRPAALAEFADVKIRSPFAEPQQPLKMAGGGQVELPIYDSEGNRTVINYDSGGNDPSVDPNPGWSGLTPGEQAAYFQDPQNAVHAGLRGFAQGLFGLTTWGRAQNFFDPSIQPAQAAITRGETPQQTFRDSELGKQAAVNAAYEAGRVTTNEEGNLVSTDTGAPASRGGETSSQSGVGNPGESADDGGGFSDTSNMAANGGLITRNGVVRRSEGSPEAGERALTPEEIAAASKPAFLTPKSGIGRRISTKPGELEGAALQGVSEMPYNLVGAPVDLATMAMRPFGYSVEKPFLGSEDLKERALKAGIRQKPPEGKAARALYELTQAGSGLLNPAAPVRGAVKAAEATGEAAKMLARDFQKYNQQLSVPGASYAVKPGGGTFAYTPNDPDRVKPITYLANLIRDYGVEAKDLGAGDELVDFLKTKAPKYFTSTYGTANDPLRTAIRDRRIDPFGADAERIPPYLVDAANNPEARGHLQAKIALEKAYDKETGIRAYALRPGNSEAYKFEQKMKKDISEKMGQEGVPIEARNPAETYPYSTVDFENYPTSSELLRRLYNQETLPPNIQQALRTSEPIYDVNPNFALLTPARVIEALQEVPANKLKNMSFPEALIQGTQALAPVRDYLAAVALAEKGAKVPRKALDMFTTPVVQAPSFGGQWVTLDKSVATKLEGKLMNHSVGDYNSGAVYGTAYTGLPYGGKKAFDEGLVRVYSLRDDQGLPKVTVEMAKSDAGKGNTWSVSQIRGRFNSEPSPETRQDIFRLFDKVDSQEGLSTIKSNSYTMSPAGERVEGTKVDWGREYDLWKTSAE
jgi:hypothetical protein